MKRTITVTGKANLSVAPDTIEIHISFDVVKETYDLARELSLLLYDKLKKSTIKNGLGETSLKTTDYSIRTKYESYQDKDRCWKERFVGYELNHRLKLSFDIDSILLGNIIRDINVCEEIPNITINYTVKDATEAKNQLLVKAIETSKRKALAMSTAAGVTLGDVLSINYSWGEMRIVSEELEMPSIMCAEECTSAMDFTPEDIDITDSVTVVWEIK